MIEKSPDDKAPQTFVYAYDWYIRYIHSYVSNILIELEILNINLPGFEDFL